LPELLVHWELVSGRHVLGSHNKII
jgi:hypothetical protein